MQWLTSRDRCCRRRPCQPPQNRVSALSQCPKAGRWTTTRSLTGQHLPPRQHLRRSHPQSRGRTPRNLRGSTRGGRKALCPRRRREALRCRHRQEAPRGHRKIRCGLRRRQALQASHKHVVVQKHILRRALTCVDAFEGCEHGLVALLLLFVALLKPFEELLLDIAEVIVALLLGLVEVLVALVLLDEKVVDFA